MRINNAQHAAQLIKDFDGQLTCLVDLLIEITDNPDCVRDNPKIVADAIRTRVRAPDHPSVYRIAGILPDDKPVEGALAVLDKLESLPPRLPPILDDLRHAAKLSELFAAARRITRHAKIRRNPKRLRGALRAAVRRVPDATSCQEPILAADWELTRRIEEERQQTWC